MKFGLLAASDSGGVHLDISPARPSRGQAKRRQFHYQPLFYSLGEPWDAIDAFLSKTDALLEALSVENV